MNNQVQIEEVNLGENVLIAGPVTRPCQEIPNIDGSNTSEVSGCDEEQVIAELMKMQAQIPERSEGISGEMLPCWMRFAPHWSDNKGIQYRYMFCLSLWSQYTSFKDIGTREGLTTPNIHGSRSRTLDEGNNGSSFSGL